VASFGGVTGPSYVTLWGECSDLRQSLRILLEGTPASSMPCLAETGR
jgi:hypothetical protein